MTGETVAARWPKPNLDSIVRPSLRKMDGREGKTEEVASLVPLPKPHKL